MPAPWRVRFAFAKRHAQLLRQNITTGSRMKHFIYNCFFANRFAAAKPAGTALRGLCGGLGQSRGAPGPTASPERLLPRPAAGPTHVDLAHRRAPASGSRPSGPAISPASGEHGALERRGCAGRCRAASAAGHEPQAARPDLDPQRHRHPEEGQALLGRGAAILWGKQENCQVAVTPSLATWEASLPMAYRLYLPREWAEDRARRRRAGVPEEIRFQTKPEIALPQIA